MKLQLWLQITALELAQLEHNNWRRAIYKYGVNDLSINKKPKTVKLWKPVKIRKRWYEGINQRFIHERWIIKMT